MYVVLCVYVVYVVDGACGGWWVLCVCVYVGGMVYVVSSGNANRSNLKNRLSLTADEFFFQ